jgi:RHS repeat-associated protein
MRSSDDGVIDAVPRTRPGVRDGWHTVQLTEGVISSWQTSFTLQVENGVAIGRRLIGPTSAYYGMWFDGQTIALRTSQGQYASIVRATRQHGTIGVPYHAVPPSVTKTALLYVDLDAPSPSANDVQIRCPADSHAMARYSVYSRTVGLKIEDTPIRYVAPHGGTIDFLVTYSERETQQPLTFSYSNLGPKWTFNWVSYVADDPAALRPHSGVYLPGGGSEFFDALTTGNQSAPHLQSRAILKRTGQNSYERLLPDGTKQIFEQSDGATAYPRKVFMTKTIDPQGREITISYDNSFRVTAITDVHNQATITVAYELPGDPLKITKVTDPFGRFAVFEYSAGKLFRITDPVGIQSEFGYAPNSSEISSLTTPYGVTQFASGESGTTRWLTITDADGTERIEYRDDAPGIAANEAVAPAASGIKNFGLHMANTFYWDKKAMAEAPGDYTKARITHWLQNSDGSVSGVPSSQKAPLESRIFFTYSDQPDAHVVGSTAKPEQVARVLGNGTTELRQFEYNSAGNVVGETDPVGRITNYEYFPDGINLKAVYQRNPAGLSTYPAGQQADKLAEYTYTAHRQLETVTDGSGLTTTAYTYTAAKQVETITNAKDETTTYAYGPAPNVPAGYLASITSPAVTAGSAVTQFKYDAAHRVQTVTDSENYTRVFSYDGLDRVTRIDFPDTTYQEFKYTRHDPVTNADSGIMTLDLTASRDRRGRWTYRQYNHDRRMTAVKDPLNRTVFFDWCGCGSLDAITDARGKTTTFLRDIQGRIYQKRYADNTAIQYLYDGQTAPHTIGATSRLQAVTDALNQTTNYLYFADGNVKQVSYANAVHPTPTVQFTYDEHYNRVETMTDGSGGTGLTSYTYHPVTSSPLTSGATRLHQIDGPFDNDTITFGYDQLGRATSQSINGVASTVDFDALGRLDTSSNALGPFTRSYEGVTPRLQTANYPNGQTTSYGYFPSNNDDRRLEQIHHLAPGSVTLSKFNYTYDDEGQVFTWRKQFGAAHPVQWANGANSMHDLADQLTNVIERDAVTQALRTTYGYGYDPAGNRTSDASGTRTFNDVNQSQEEVCYLSNGCGPRYPYDANGNMLSDGVYNYHWDAANRLIKIESVFPASGGDDTSAFGSGVGEELEEPGELLPGQVVGPPTFTRTRFTYNGLNLRVRQTEESYSSWAPVYPPQWTLVSDRRYVWSGTTLAEERDSTGATVLKRYFADGEQRISGGAATSLYYTRDHLGSIRELTDASGAVRARYDYDPFGVTTKVTGDLEADFGYTGHYRHAVSGLYLAPYRANDPAIGRWLNRDPIAEDGGLNLYGYVGNSPMNRTDPDGLFWREFGQELGKGFVMFGQGAKSYFSDLGAGAYQVSALNGWFGIEEQMMAEENAAIVANALRLARKCPQQTKDLLWEYAKRHPERIAGRVASGMLFGSATRSGLRGGGLGVGAARAGSVPISLGGWGLANYGAATNLIISGRSYLPEDLIQAAIGGYAPGQ